MIGAAVHTKHVAMLSFILPAIVLIGFGSAQTQDDCPASLTRDKYLTVHGGVCYEFMHQYPLEYTDANADCSSRGGTLVLVKTKEVSDYLIDQLVYQFGSATPFWIGLTDKAKEGTYIWEDGTPLSGYSNWAPTRNGTSVAHDCVYFQPGKNGFWDEDACQNTFLVIFRHERPYICQYRTRAGATTKSPALTILYPVV